MAEEQVDLERGLQQDEEGEDKVDTPLMDKHKESKTASVETVSKSDSAFGSGSVNNVTSKAKKDLEEINAKLIVPENEQNSIDFMKHPGKWLNGNPKHNTKNYIVKTFRKDDDYIDYIKELLILIVENRPIDHNEPIHYEDKEKDTRNYICTPLLLLKCILIAKDNLKNRQDPMRTALRLQRKIGKYARKEKLNNNVYHFEGLQEIPNQFALWLVEGCAGSPPHIKQLLCLNEKEEFLDSMFDDVFKSKNKDLTANPIYSQIIIQKAFGGSDGESISWRYVLKKLIFLIAFNLTIGPYLLPLTILQWIFKKDLNCCFCLCLFGIVEFFYSTIYSFMADLANYLILFGLLFAVTSNAIPDIKPTTDFLTLLADENATTKDAVSELIAAHDKGHTFEFYEKDSTNRTLQIHMDIAHYTYKEILLCFCIFSKITVEIFQIVINKGSGFWGHFKTYRKNATNLIDVFMLCFLVAGMSFKFSMLRDAEGSGINKYYNITNKKIMGAETLVSRRIVYSVHLYCMGAICALVNLFYSCFIFYPGIGPLLSTIQQIIAKDLKNVLIMMAFFTVGFIMPVYSMALCYRTIYEIENLDSEDSHFYKMKDMGSNAMTLVWSVFGGQDYTGSLYSSKDDMTTWFMTITMLVYTCIMAVMCLNLFIGMVTDRYAKQMVNRKRDCAFAKFQLYMKYGVSQKAMGMPFLFPFCVLNVFMLIPIIKNTYFCKKKRKEEEKRMMRSKCLLGQLLCKQGDDLKLITMLKNVVKEQELEKAGIFSENELEILMSD